MKNPFKRSNVRRQELHCHGCGRYVQFDLDLSLDGNHVLDCPNCGHEHCRIVKKGRITGERWDQRNRTYSTFQISSATMDTTGISTFDLVGGTGTGTMGVYAATAWLDCSTTAS